MTLEEAIEHCNDVINSCNIEGCKIDHIQLKDWLQELKQFREKTYGKSKNYPNDLAEWAIKEIKQVLHTNGWIRIHERNRIRATLFQYGYFDKNFKGRKIYEISPECSEFLDKTKDK